MATGSATPVDENVLALVKRAEPVGCVLRTKRWRVRRALRWAAWDIRPLICHHGLLQDFFPIKPAATLSYQWLFWQPA
jgi:hypothetical protein